MTRPGSCRVCGASPVEPVEAAWDVPLWRCRACRSAFVWPVPGRDDLEARYRAEHDRGKWESLFEAVPREVFQEREALLAGLVANTGRALDVGCGDGGYLEVCRNRGWWVVGTELDPGLARRARRTSGVPVVTGYLDALAPGAAFDAVTFWDVLEHVPEPGVLLEEAGERMKPGGIVAATMPNAAGVTARLHGGRWKYFDWEAYGHLYHLSGRGLETLFERGGFRVIHSATRGSTDLRDVPEVRWGRRPGPLLTWILDRASGLLARAAVPLGLGNTLLVVGRKP